jgi:hypothetical protein
MNKGAILKTAWIDCLDFTYFIRQWALGDFANRQTIYKIV